MKRLTFSSRAMELSLPRNLRSGKAALRRAKEAEEEKKREADGKLEAERKAGLRV